MLAALTGPPPSEIEAALAWFAVAGDAQLRLLIALCAAAALAGVAWRRWGGPSPGPC